MTAADEAPSPGSLRFLGYKEDGARWIMLRPLSAQTFKVARLLAAVGLDPYCPEKTILVRLPRSSKRVPRIYPIWPGLVFLPEGQYGAALNTRHRVVDGELVPWFSFWQNESGLMRVWDCEISGLRDEEQKEKEKQRFREESLRMNGEEADGLEVGMEVVFVGGAFVGKTCVIKRLDKVMAHVILTNAPGRVQVPRFRLAKVVENG